MSQLIDFLNILFVILNRILMMKCIRMVLFQLYSGIDGPVDMKLTCGIIVVEEKASLGKEDKVSNLLSLVFN